MEKEKLCVFCRQKPGAFRSGSIICGGTYQFSCKSCEKELKDMDDVEKCRRALQLGLAENAKRLEEYIQLVTEAEEHRPACLRCGAKLKFGAIQELDNSPMRDGLLSDTFDILPAYCESCGKMEFYNPAYVHKNKFISYLIKKDMGE